MMTDAAAADLADEIAHDVVPAPDDCATDGDSDAAMDRVERASKAAYAALLAGKSVEEATAAAEKA